jgi:FMN phosphatase YigB (HAD superfamily)
MTHIKAIIFDVGGVLVRTEDRTPRRRLEEQYGLQPGEAEFLVYNSEKGQQAQRGEITAAALWGWIQARFDLDAAALADFPPPILGRRPAERHRCWRWCVRCAHATRRRSSPTRWTICTTR